MTKLFKMKLNKYKSIQNNLAFWFLLLALTPLISGILITYIQQKKVIEERTFDKLTAIRDLKALQLESWIDRRMGDLKIVSSDFEIRALENIFDKETKSTGDIKAIETARKLLNRYQKDFNTYEEIFIVDAKTGIIEISNDKNFEGKNVSQNPYFTIPLESGEIYIKDIYYSKTLGRPQMTFSKPIYCLAHNKHIIGILVMRVNLYNSLYKLLSERVGLGETGETLIVNKDAITINDLRWHENAVLKLKIDAKPAVNAANGNTGITVTADYRGKNVLAAYTYIPETEWGFVCKQDLAELNAPIQELIKSFLFIFFISLLLIVLITYFVSKSISSPIIKMNRVAQKLGSGDFSARNDIQSANELGLLAESFNKMAEMTESKIKIQQGVVDISETMIGKSNMQAFGTSLLKHLMKITDANMSTFYILNEGTMEYEHFASVGANEEMLSPFSVENPQGEFGNALSTKKIFHLKDIPEDTIFKFKTMAGEAIPKEIITIPIVVENNIIALISLVNIQKFDQESINILNQSWTNINTAYSNLLSNERTSVFAEHLSIINQQLEAQTEELQDQTEELQDQAEELQEQNIELETQRVQVETANKLKTEFLSNMSHELRTPLNSIMALSRVLIMQAKEKLSEEENNYLGIVERNGKRLLSLINDILDLSKIEAGKMEINPKPISVEPFLQILKENMQSLSEEKGLALNLEIEDDLPKIETDESRLHQVLTNVIGNAVKFTNTGSVDILAHYDATNVYIKVKDSGIGIAKEILPHIFDEFRQADGTSSRQYEGTGLGLAIAYKLTQILGGNISVESKLGEGSLFTISIPIKWNQEMPQALASNFKDKSDFISDKKMISIDNAENRILIVEDNPDAIVQLKAVLKNENYKIDIASGGQEALDYLKRNIPDGIILDLMMPDIDGFEVLEQLRGTEQTKNIPILILTAKDLTRSDLARLSSNNVQQLIQKGDIDIEGLLNKVKLMLGNEPKVQSSKIQVPDVSLKQTSLNLQPKSGLPNVLVIEDNVDNMTSIKAILKGNYTILEAYDGEQGLEICKSEQPALILLDMSLPKMSGEQIVEILKTSNSTKDIPVIAVTAQAMMGDKEKFINFGCDAYVSKPIDHLKLLEEIDKLLNGK